MSNASDNRPWDSLRQNLINYPDKPTPKKKIDLIIDALLVAPPSVWSARMHEALFCARELKEELAKSETETETLKKCLLQMQNAAIELVKPEQEVCVCCGDYEKCMKPCTPRGRWLANQQMTRLKQEKGQFVGGVPSVSQQREWVGLTDDEIDSCFEDHGWSSSAMYHMVVRAIEAALRSKNT